MVNILQYKEEIMKKVIELSASHQLIHKPLCCRNFYLTESEHRMHTA